EKPFKTRRKRLFGCLWNIGSPTKSTERRYPRGPLPEVDQIARITRQLPLKITHPAKLLPVRIFHPALHHILVALVIHLLDYEQPDHEPHRLGRTTLLAVILPKGLFKIPPRYSLSQLPQGVAGITLLIECRHQKRRLSARLSLL